jgi:regulator of PEP synthase PpsR (kinase-PPPase family)
MPRYNLNQDDIQIIVDSLTSTMSSCSSTKQWERMNRLKSRLISKVDAVEHPIIHDDPVWNFYNKKDS